MGVIASVSELVELAGSQTSRCLGCGQVVVDRERSHGCPRYYGIGERVDFELWYALIDRTWAGADRPLVAWAAAESALGLPSWFASAVELAELIDRTSRSGLLREEVAR